MTHSYILLALGTVFVAIISRNIWLWWKTTPAGWLIFLASLLACVWLAVAVMWLHVAQCDPL